MDVGPAAARLSVPGSDDVRNAVRTEELSIAWMVIEASVALSAGVLAGSVLLIAFGFDSVIELVSAGVLLWRLRTEADGGNTERIHWAERRAAWIAALGLALLCAYLVLASFVTIAFGVHARPSAIGTGLAAVTLPMMIFLARRKRTIAERIGSAALRADSACSTTCAYMAGALLAGLALNAVFGWWWADTAAALLFLVWLVPETRGAFRGARAGTLSCARCD